MDLVEAVQHGRMDSVVTMFEHGNDIFINHNGVSLVHIAAKHHQLACLEFLIKRGLDINLKNDNGETPLHIFVTTDTANSEAREVAEFLVNHGADPFIKDKLGDTPMSRTQRMKKKDQIQIL